MAVKLGQCLVSTRQVSHHDEAKTSRFTGVRVHHDLNLGDGSKLLEQLFQLSLIDVSRYTGNKEVGTLVLGVNVIVVLERLLGSSVHVVSVVSVVPIVSSVVTSIKVIMVVVTSVVPVVPTVEIVTHFSVSDLVVTVISTVEVVSVVVLSVITTMLGLNVALILVVSAR